VAEIISPPPLLCSHAVVRIEGMDKEGSRTNHTAQGNNANAIIVGTHAH
jgi:hypothetical protein